MRCYFVTREKRLGWDWFTTGLVSLWSPSYVHCAVGNRRVVLNPLPRGNEFWPALAFHKYPNLAGYFQVPPVGKPLRDYESVHKRLLSQYVAKGLSGGRLYRERHSDCVTTVCDVLGIKGPWTPDQLWDHLRKKGYVWTEREEMERV